MMLPVARIDFGQGSAVRGQVRLDWQKATWNYSIIISAVVLGPIFFSISAVLLFAVLTYSMLLIGHSVGMHRMMIHRMFSCPKWLERTLVYVGVLVGMSGPYGIVRIHDLRDWAQRQSACHEFFAHTRGYFRDITWQLGHRFEFEEPPHLRIEENLSDDRWYRFMERTWRFHQLLIAVPLYLMGGLPWVVWGVFVRVAVSVVGHWTVTYFCHNPGPGRWKVLDACVQASNIPGLGIVTYGECWHNNHHAFPESARIGLDPGQCDPAWRFIQFLGLLGLARNIGLPREEAKREDLLLDS